jgi:hypothetical protein
MLAFDSADPKTENNPMQGAMPLNEKANRCTATTRDGSRCKNPAVTGSNVCRMHGAGGGAPAGNQNAVTHGGYARPSLPHGTRTMFMLGRHTALTRALDAALDDGDASRANRLLGLLTTLDNCMTRQTGRFRRSLSP